MLLLQTAAANLMAAFVAFRLYRFRGIGGALVPRDGAEGLWLLLCAFVSVAVGVVLGAFPGTRPWVGGGSLPLSLAAVCRYVVPIVVGLMCLLPLYVRDDERLLRGASRWWLVLFVPTTIFCAFAPTMIEGYPLSWLFAVPTVWAGLTMTRRWAGVSLIAFAITATFAPFSRTTPPPLGGVLYPWSLVDLTFAFLIYLAVVLVSYREDSARLTRGIARLAKTANGRRQLLRSILTPMSDALLVVGADGQIRRANDSAKRMLTGAAEAAGRAGSATPVPGAARLSALGLASVEAEPREQLPTERLLCPDPEEVVRLDAWVPAPAGDRRVRVRSVAVRARDEQLTLVMIKDVTAGHERQRELESFAGTVAHDLKGPLTALSGWLEVGMDDLRDGDGGTAPTALSHARNAVEGMKALIQDYLAYAVSRGGVLHVTDVSLYDVVMDIVRVYSGLDGSGPTFEVDTPHVLLADPSLTRQLIANLIGNGTKYARTGEEPYIRIRSLDDAPGWAAVQVADRGRGLPPGAQDRIFRRLDRGPGDHEGIHGVGLGLALCQAIVARHGGQIRAENNEWGGATFTFTMPAAAERQVCA